MAEGERAPPPLPPPPEFAGIFEENPRAQILQGRNFSSGKWDFPPEKLPASSPRMSPRMILQAVSAEYIPLTAAEVDFAAQIL